MPGQNTGKLESLHLPIVVEGFQLLRIRVRVYKNQQTVSSQLLKSTLCE